MWCYFFLLRWCKNFTHKWNTNTQFKCTGMIVRKRTRRAEYDRIGQNVCCSLVERKTQTEWMFWMNLRFVSLVMRRAARMAKAHHVCVCQPLGAVRCRSLLVGSTTIVGRCVCIGHVWAKRMRRSSQQRAQCGEESLFWLHDNRRIRPDMILLIQRYIFHCAEPQEFTLQQTSIATLLSTGDDSNRNIGQMKPVIRSTLSNIVSAFEWFDWDARLVNNFRLIHRIIMSWQLSTSTQFAYT